MNVVVVKVDRTISNERKSQIRDELLESLQKGILVVDNSYSIEVMDLPLEHELMLAFDTEMDNIIERLDEEIRHIEHELMLAFDKV